MPEPSPLDSIFGALSDPTRRAIVEWLLGGAELSVGEVAERFDISTPAISRHLQVLERAGLIERRVEAQWRYVRASPEALSPVESWVSRQRRHWNAALDRLEALAARTTSARKKS